MRGRRILAWWNSPRSPAHIVRFWIVAQPEPVGIKKALQKIGEEIMLSQSIVAFGAPLEEIEAPTPVPQGTEVLLKVHHAGVCHSDVHIHDGYFDLGGCKRIQIGWAICPACARGEDNLCKHPRQLGCSPEIVGGFATHVLVPHPRYLLDYSDGDPALAAAYMCSGLTAFGAMKKVGALAPADQIAVIGCGGVGLMGIRFARALTGKGPIAADIDESRLAAARDAGAVATYNTSDETAANRLMVETGGGAFAAVDFVGSEKSFAFANGVVRKGGRIIVVGLFGGSMGMPLPMFPLRALSITGSFVGSLAEAKEMMELVRNGKIAPIPLEKRPLSSAGKTLDDLRGGRITGRVVLTPD
jgi:D-arabinose 1-dehydrogenase-like Zn-dependent alcohol dehydrogenase